MVDKKKKYTKHIDGDKQKNPEIDTKKSAKNDTEISDIFLSKFKTALDEFDKIPELKRTELYGNKKYLEQFWEYFKETHPHRLEKIDKKDLPRYIQALEDQGFSVGRIIETTGKLHNEFKAEDTEHHVIEKSLSDLQNFCEDKKNKIPDGTFKKFASAAGFTHDTLVIYSDGEIKTLDSLSDLWNDFIEKEGITLGKTSAEGIENILTPEYNPTERIMVTVALTKIRKELKGSLRVAFDATFTLPITIFSSYQNLLTFRGEWSQFLTDHAAEIDTSLAKKLDSVIVTNGDIYKGLLKSGRKLEGTKGFSEQEQYFRRTFNKFVTRQLFEEVQKTQETIDHYITSMGKTFSEFPPYVNDIMNMDEYKFNAKTINTIDVSYSSDIQAMDDQIVTLNQQYESANDEEKKELRKKMKALKQEKEQRKWQAYIAFLRSKNAPLAEVFAQLVTSKFNFAVLSADQQQLLIDVLIKNKLEDSIKNKVPELLSVKEEKITQFIHDLFDLKKMDLTIPTRHGPVPLSFVKKEFLASARTQLPAISDLEDLKNLPLNFVTQLTESNAAFFEDSPIFDSLYTKFSAKNGDVKINDAYKVRIIKDGKLVEGYLSPYSPIDEKNNEEYTGKELYLYSQPISSPNQERELVPRPHDENKPIIPVVIKDEEQKACDIEILDKKINLNGDAFGALLFGYVLGQQSMNTTMSPEKEKELAGKLDKLDVYREKEEGEEEEPEPIKETPDETKEDSEKTKFKKERHQLKGYNFPEKEHEQDFGFVKGSRLFIPFASSEVPPENMGNAWMQMEIVDINEKKGTFKVKIHGGELRLGKSEGAVKELPMHTNSFKSIKKAFGDKMYKLPNTSKIGFDQQMNMLTNGGVISALDKHFGSLKFNGSKFNYTLGNFSGKEITHFGIYQPKAIGESVDQESGNLILYKIKANSNGTITVSGDSTDNNYAKNFPARDMDYATFMLFVKEKGLQPKCKEQVQAIDAKVKAEKEETPTTVRGFSINNVLDFFKNGVNKLKDGIKKYDEERTEDLTDLLTNQGQLWNNIGGFLSPFGRISSSFENMGMEAFLARDDRVWKKVEKRTKFYEDFDYSKIYTMYIKPMLDGTIKVVPHYKIAALLLVHLKKGKGPYAKDAKSTAKGNRVGTLLGAEHQQRYLTIREKKIRDLEENAHIHGGPWADQTKNELVELEMRYIVHVMDGRHMGMGDPEKYKFQDKYSKKFCSELETTYTGFFKQSTVEEGFTNAQDSNFEFASVEYFRQLADRPQQALPYLKVMATKAINDTQWQVFETGVLAAVLSGVLLNMTYSSTQSFIQKICRTRGFIPGIFAKDLKQQSKIQRLLDMFSGEKFTKETGYSPTDYSYRENKGPGDFINAFTKRTDKGSTRKKLSNFFELIGGNVDGKTLLDIYSDPKLSVSDKLLLEEYIEKSNEKDEELDNDVTKNTSSLTGSVLTKSQSVVEKMVKFDQGGFAGKDGDEIQNMKAFSEKMHESIPKEKLASQEQTKFFVKKFFNRFGERGFSGNRMTEFLKRLKWCKENKGSDEKEDILYYSIVGEIINSLASNNANPPAELMGALGAWKDFFSKNIDNILQPDVITSCFGGSQYKVDYDKYEPKLEPRETSSFLLDKEDNYMYMQGLNKEEKAAANAKKNMITRNRNYLNKDLYKLADDLSRKCSGFSNTFRKDLTSTGLPKKTSSSVEKNTGAKIKNKDILDNLINVIENKPIEEDTSDDYMPEYDPNDPYNGGI